jgi:predicted ATP-grasp superfamily ATP-dependent carboligase
MTNKFCIIDSPFSDWTSFIEHNKKIRFFRLYDILKYPKIKLEVSKYKIISISINNYYSFNNFKNNIFINNLYNIDLLDNKSKFSEYMLINYKNNYAETYYYNYNNIVYINKQSENENKFIIKPNKGCSGNDIKIINKIDYNNLPKNSIINKYIEHDIYYVGHFLILNGKVIDKVYFYNTNDDKNLIKKGKIIDYKVTEKLLLDDSIFNLIFDNLKYSGFACIDFTIKNDNIIIFEINPRPGGSLIYNKKYFDKFIDTIILNYS